MQELLRFITCGSVDDGKSTLIGRLLWESQQLLDDQVHALQQDSKKYGTQGDELDFALLVDGLSAEREQGITIDVAYRFFSTSKRRFIVADTPGHEQYTRNMVTGASTAEVAILLLDARQGVLTQTRRHAYLAALMGMRHVVLAINKMDLVGYDASIFARVEKTFADFAQPLAFESITVIPISALKGDNVTERSISMPWYTGPTLLQYLETVEIHTEETARCVFPVQWVNRPDAQFRGFSGSITRGVLQVGDRVRVTASGEIAQVARIVTMDADLSTAQSGQAITVTLDREIDVSRGDIFSLANEPLEQSDQFEATLIWMSDVEALVGRTYDIKLATQWTAASITAIKYHVDVNTLEHKAGKTLCLNDIAVCNIAAHKPLTFDTYVHSKALGGFLIVDRVTRATLGVGLIRHNLRRAQNIHKQALSVTRVAREQLNGHGAKVIWFTGLSGSGKSTIANALEVALHQAGYRTYILDGDNVRHGLNRDLGFDTADRVENIRRVAEVARLMFDAGLVVMTAFISPFREERDMVRELIGQAHFVEVYINTSLEVCESRDVKGLYRKARSGALPNLSGIGSSYEPPLQADIILDTAMLSVQESVDTLLMYLKCTDAVSVG